MQRHTGPQRTMHEIYVRQQQSTLTSRFVLLSIWCYCCWLSFVFVLPTASQFILCHFFCHSHAHFLVVTFRGWQRRSANGKFGGVAWLVLSCCWGVTIAAIDNFCCCWWRWTWSVTYLENVWKWMSEEAPGRIGTHTCICMHIFYVYMCAFYTYVCIIMCY